MLFPKRVDIFFEHIKKQPICNRVLHIENFAKNARKMRGIFEKSVAAGGRESLGSFLLFGCKSMRKFL
ncbi:hypothetical protein B7992_15435 [Fibrobacter sp. UWH1]|nr:hypothetical protein B7992_15435 [Fibrobacter sp. UWH1]